jgi:hypothetical protein|tara:strand:+ start:761 stop:1129 length:369 start_codon:yes stop_codon:yes gene_type:complete
MGNDELILVRKNRFVLDGGNLPEMFVKNVDVDFIKKTLKVELYEVCDEGTFPCHEWVERFEDEQPDEDFFLTTFDGCGVKLFEYVFYNPRLEDRAESFDYVDSDAATITTVFSFAEVKRIKL